MLFTAGGSFEDVPGATEAISPDTGGTAFITLVQIATPASTVPMTTRLRPASLFFFLIVFAMFSLSKIERIYTGILRGFSYR
jgi:hypothetical protein